MEERPTILIIDDTPMQIRLLSDILMLDYDVLVATTGRKGLKLAAESGVDLILLDIVMEDMSGYEVIEALKNCPVARDIPVIFITAEESKESEEKGLSAGAVDYISKPFTGVLVRARVGLQMKLIDQMRTIRKLSMYDSLTDVRNRRGFNVVMQEHWRRSMDSGKLIAMIILDIDDFKGFNDRYGHSIGDVCLKVVAGALSRTIRTVELDYVFRWGGEEFAIILPSTSLEDACVLAERLRATIEKEPIATGEGVTVTVTISLGVGACIPQRDSTPSDFCNNVDTALYRAKTNGKNRVEAYED